jgi:hypothetical protein
VSSSTCLRAATLATARCLLGQSTGTAKKSTAPYPKRPETVRAFVGINTPSRPVALALERSLAARLR